MMGYKFHKEQHLLPDCVTRKDVTVYSMDRPPDTTGAVPCELPSDVEVLFRHRSNAHHSWLHTVCVDDDGNVVDKSYKV